MKNSIEIDDMLKKVFEANASDLHITSNLPPTIRVNNVLQPLVGYDALPPETVENIIDQLVNENQKLKLIKERSLDFSYQYKKSARFRINAFFEKGLPALAFRLIPTVIPTVDELGLPHILYEFAKLPKGLVLVTGATGTGKTTTLAAMINWMNHNRNGHIITIEDPIEFIFESNKSLIQQREMYVDTLTWKGAIKSALREDIDVLLVGEMRDYKTMAAAITAAETGHLVLATLHTNSAAQTIDRIIDVFPEHQQIQIRIQLAAVLEGIITQTLITGIDKSKMYPALEILIANDAVRNTIREGKTHFIDNIINTSYDIGMRSMERSLAELVKEGKIELEEALKNTLKPDEVTRLLG